MSSLSFHSKARPKYFQCRHVWNTLSKNEEYLRFGKSFSKPLLPLSNVGANLGVC